MLDNMQKKAELQKESGSTLKGLKYEKINGRQKLQIILEHI